MPFDTPLAIHVPGTRFKVNGRFQGHPSQPLFVMVHGLTGNMDEAFYRGGCDYMAKRGYATFRLNLYGWPKGSRRIHQTTLKTHAQDLDAVTRYFRRHGFRKIFVAGHSYGGATILLSNPENIDGSILWDPSHGVTFTRKRWGLPPAKYIPQLDGYLLDWGVWYVIGRKMVEEADELDWDNLATQFSAPTRIVCAGKGVLRKGCARYFATLPGKKDLKIIPHATHYFCDKPGTEEAVYKLTFQWCERFRKNENT